MRKELSVTKELVSETGLTRSLSQEAIAGLGGDVSVSVTGLMLVFPRLRPALVLIFTILYFIILCIWVFCLQVHVHAMCVQCLQSPKEGF